MNSKEIPKRDTTITPLLTKRSSQPTQDYVMPITKAAEVNLKALKAGNQRFVQGQSKATNNRIPSLDEGMNITAIVLGCSDSRVPPEIIFDQGIQDLFTVRVAGNIATYAQIESIEYAAETWDVPLVIVLGHTDCRAVAGTIDYVKSETSLHRHPLEYTIRDIASGIESWFKEQKRAPSDELLRAATEQHINATIALLLKSSHRLSMRVSSEKMNILGAIYNVENGTTHFWETA